MGTKQEFEKELKVIKKETAYAFQQLADKYRNVKDWKVKFNYDWVLPVSTWVDTSDTYDALSEDSE